MLTTTVQLDGCRVKCAVVIIIIIVWQVTTLRYGPDWLTPAELAFFTLLLNSHRSTSRPRALNRA